MERRAQIAEAKLTHLDETTVTARQSPTLQPNTGLLDEGSVTGNLSPSSAKRHDREHSASARVIDHAGLRLFSETSHTDWYPDSDADADTRFDPYETVQPSESDAGGPVHELEAPPTETDDFSWDEQSSGERARSLDRAGGAVQHDEPSVVDGMASLSVEERGAGYLGVASGAAMLRLLLPDAEHRRPLKVSMQGRQRYSSGMPSAPPPDLGWVPTPVWTARDIASIDLDAAINSYFSLYHISYPIVHEASFRAQYSQVIARPTGFNALAYMIGALGLFTKASGPGTRDADLFEAAKSNISIDSLESGNLTLVQTLALMSNYLQKRNKPNSGYNYLGLALHMAMGLGLHKEFHNWQIAKLSMEIRRRVWWCLHVFALGAMITFGRPLSWPAYGVEALIPLNIIDNDLTTVSSSMPPSRTGFTTYWSVSVQARFHLATSDIYSKVISANFADADELVRLDDERIEPWRAAWLPSDSVIPSKFRLAWSTMVWRYKNFRLIMYRPFVIRHVLQLRNRPSSARVDRATLTAVERCLFEAQSTIASIQDYWATCEHTCMGAWYGLYFLFQAVLIPVLCLRNDPTSDQAQGWREQIQSVLTVLESMLQRNPASKECRQVITSLCAGFLTIDAGSGFAGNEFAQLPVEESPQTQLSGVYPMMWPGGGANATEIDFLMPDHVWPDLMGQVPPDSTEFQDDQSYSQFWT
ncbi:hypothetical protein LTR53_000198 [Teratosphaeriaceae sp. CCFEE 6253]|nr:hypothetical protein LTR53_000198 [Teratosphaeriaceae sp. CCFEE 6253]